VLNNSILCGAYAFENSRYIPHIQVRAASSSPYRRRQSPLRLRWQTTTVQWEHGIIIFIIIKIILHGRSCGGLRASPPSRPVSQFIIILSLCVSPVVTVSLSDFRLRRTGAQRTCRVYTYYYRMLFATL